MRRFADMYLLKSILVLLPLLLLGSGQAAWAQVMDLGTYPGGTWAEMWDINDFGMAVGFGDNADGKLRPIGVALRGPQSLQWVDLGTLGGEFTDWGLVCWECGGVANSGLIVGASPTKDGLVHAFAWRKQSGMADLGTLDGPTPQSWELGIALQVTSPNARYRHWAAAG